MRVSAAVMGLIENSDDENEDDIHCSQGSSKLESYLTEQTETWKDVQINPELSEDKKAKAERLVRRISNYYLMFQLSPI